MRGGTFFSISIDAGKWSDGRTGIRVVKDCDYDFVAFAGPWAEARAQWPSVPLSHRDSDGHAFDDCVAEAFLNSG